MQPEYLYPFSQVPATCPYPESDQSSLNFLTYFFKIHFSIILSSTPRSS
jgi:hypothetical protein